MDARAANSIHAIVTDPPYGLKEYTHAEKEKLRKGRGGVWRIPPSFDGCTRSPLPRFTVLSDEERANLKHFFAKFAQRALRVLTPARPEERALSPHPSLKPQSFMRQVVRASLPLGKGVVLDPFMGGGSTIAAAVSLGYESIGLENDPTFFQMASAGIPRLAALSGSGKGSNGKDTPHASVDQQSLALLDES